MSLGQAPARWRMQPHSPPPSATAPLQRSEQASHAAGGAVGVGDERGPTSAGAPGTSRDSQGAQERKALNTPSSPPSSPGCRTAMSSSRGSTARTVQRGSRTPASTWSRHVDPYTGLSLGAIHEQVGGGGCPRQAYVKQGVEMTNSGAKTSHVGPCFAGSNHRARTFPGACRAGGGIAAVASHVGTKNTELQ